jgi:hypothetical protein
MRLELLDDQTRRFVLALLNDLPASVPRRRRSTSQARPTPSAQPRNDGVTRLAQELIEKQCGGHSLALIYEFLLRTRGSPVLARVEFERFLSGEWSACWVEAAHLAVKEQQEARGKQTDDAQQKMSAKRVQGPFICNSRKTASRSLLGSRKPDRA